MSNWMINKTVAHDYRTFRITLDRLPSSKAARAVMTAKELLNNRTERDNARMKPYALSAHSMRNDLYSSAVSSGISTVTDGMQLLIPAVDDSFNDNFTDSQFIENYVFKVSYYEDQIKSAYTGDELTAKLKELDAISGEVLDKLAGKFASSIGAFFNGTQAWLNDSRSAVVEPGNGFNVSAFKEHIIGLVRQGRTTMEGIKRDYAEQWAETLRTGGADSSFFVKALEATADQNSASQPAMLEKMGYSDIRAVSQAVTALGRGFYTNSSDLLAAYLGQYKAKSNIIVSRIPMSDLVKQAFVGAVNQNVALKISSYRATWRHGMDDAEKAARFGSIYNSFANHSITGGDSFAEHYANSLKALYDAMTDRPDSMESPLANHIRMAQSCLESLANDWNSFLEAIGVEDESYRVSGLGGNILDVTV